jgi:hypothetical protein
MQKDYIGSHTDDYQNDYRNDYRNDYLQKNRFGSHFGSHWMTTRKRASVVALEGVNGVNEKKVKSHARHGYFCGRIYRDIISALHNIKDI